MNEKPSQTVVKATYKEQRIPAYKGNPLIEALPPSLTDEELLWALSLTPDFDPSQRHWANHERLMMLESLANFMVPMSNHLELCRALDAMLRTGYVGRSPRTPGHSEIFRKISDRETQAAVFRQSAHTLTPQLSTALIGISGMGKTTTVKRWCASIPQVIYHPDLNLYQVPYLHIEMPSDGSSIKGLAQGILHKLDEIIPGADYHRTYSQRGKAGSDTLMRNVARLMNTHLVGMLICDEVQNLANARKNAQTVMTELVSACNDLKVPILFIGTNKAASVLTQDFRQARRSSGHSIAPWDRLQRGTPSEPGDWEGFVEVLWGYQWVHNPVALDELCHQVLYDCSQGIIDLAIKLFVSAQARAILLGTERLTPELIAQVFDSEFQLMHPMIDALRSDRPEDLLAYDDIAPLDLQTHLKRVNHKLSLKKSPLFSVTAQDATFAPRLTAGMAAMGVDPTLADQVAQSLPAKNPTMTLAQGFQAVAATLTPPRAPRKKSSASNVVQLPADRFDARPDDYRRAVAHAPASGTKVMEQLLKFGMAPKLEEILEL